MSLPPTVLFRLSDEDIVGQQASLNRQRQVEPGARVVMSPAAAKGVTAMAAMAAAAAAKGRRLRTSFSRIKRKCEPYDGGREREKWWAAETTAQSSLTAREAGHGMKVSISEAPAASMRGPRWRRLGFRTCRPGHEPRMGVKTPLTSTVIHQECRGLTEPI